MHTIFNNKSLKEVAQQDNG